MEVSFFFFYFIIYSYYYSLFVDNVESLSLLCLQNILNSSYSSISLNELFIASDTHHRYLLNFQMHHTNSRIYIQFIKIDAFSDGTIMLSVPLKKIDTDHPEEEEWGNSPIDADYDFDQELAGLVKYLITYSFLSEISFFYIVSFFSLLYIIYLRR